MKILGLNGWTERGHDGGASLIIDGKLIYAVEEERLTRLKHAYDTIPKKSIEHALNFSNLTLDDIDKFYIGWNYPDLFKMLNKKFITKKLMSKLIFGSERYANKIEYVTHHIAHAFSSFYPSNYNEALVFVIDGQGEYMATSIFSANKKTKKMDLLMETPISLGYFYAGVTKHIGFNSGEEGKTMGLASYGTPNYYEELKKFINVDENGILKCIFTINKKSKDEEVESLHKWEELLNKILPKRSEPIKKIDDSVQKYADLAASAEKLLEEIVITLVTKYIFDTDIHNICIAGGVGLNCPMSSAIESLNIVDNVFVQPASNDGGISLGAAIYGAVKNGDNVDIEMIPYLGDSFSEQDILNAIKEKNYEYEYYEDIEKQIALLLSKEKIVGNFQGRLEFGPRALGNRSILSSPLKKETLEKINNLKGREIWRPLAPAVLYDNQTDIFDSNIFSPYMTKNFGVLEKARKSIPVATHVDSTARVQSVTKKYNERFYNIINEFYKITNVPVVINTSFNLRGEPIVNTPLEAINSFEKIGLDYLALGNYIIKKKVKNENNELNSKNKTHEILNKDVYTQKTSNFVEDLESAKYYDALPRFSRNVYDLLEKKLNMSNKVIADVGCGTGRIAIDLLEYGNKVFAIDPDVNMRTICNDKCSKFKDKFILINGTASKMNIDNNIVDFVLVSQSYHRFDPKPFKEECKRVLKKDGKVLIIWYRLDWKNEVYSKLLSNLKECFKTYESRYGSLNEVDGSKNEEKENISSVKELFNNKYIIEEIESDFDMNLDEFINLCLSMHLFPIAHSLTTVTKIINSYEFDKEKYISNLNKIFIDYSKKGKLTLPLRVQIIYNEEEL